MRSSITIKLILGFLLVGLISILLIVLLARQSTRQEFNRFVTDRRGQEMVSSLKAYYAEHGSWQGVQEAIYELSVPVQPAPNPGGRPPFTLADQNGRAILDGAGFKQGDILPEKAIQGGAPIEVSGKQVATLVLERLPFPTTPREAEFIRRI